MIDREKVNLATRVVEHYVGLAKEHSLSPSEYLVYNGLIYACYKPEQEINFLQTASTADVARQIIANRETARRALDRLNEYGLAKKVDTRWLFNF